MIPTIRQKNHLVHWFFSLSLLLFSGNALSQSFRSEKKTYKNPIIHSDFSDPDVIRVGDDFFMVASSFNASPGLPILQSKDLVNWKLITYAVPKNLPEDLFSTPQHGNGIWAPSIRYHKNEFYIYYPDPDFGIYLTKATKIEGPWSKPLLIDSGKGLIDPCVLWDDNGKNYLIHAYAGSRAGIKSILVIKELNKAADKIIGSPVLIYDGHETDPTIEGPKIYKQDGYYYVFAPAGGVATGWQTVLRSKNIFGPYERRVVLEQGSSAINGPHQGAWVKTKKGEDWFVHFQDKGAYGRIIHLQPMKWENGWPVMGIDADRNKIGEPVDSFQMPDITVREKFIPEDYSDEFNENSINKYWQWQANPKREWSFCYPAKGILRLNSVLKKEATSNLWQSPNLLLQKFPAEKFSVTTKILFNPHTIGETAGLVVMGLDYAAIVKTINSNGSFLVLKTCKNADQGTPENEVIITTANQPEIYLQASIDSGAVVTFGYSFDGKQFTELANKFQAKPGKWIGAKIGLFCDRTLKTNDGGFADVDWFRVAVSK